MATSTIPQTGKGATPKVELRRTIRASRRRIFEAWTRPEEIRKWFGPAGTEVHEAHADVREGGEWSIVMTACDDHAKRNEAHGEYVRIIPDQLLSFTWTPGRWPDEKTLVTIELRDVEGGTELHLVHEGFTNEEARARHEQGWTGTLEKLAAFVAPAPVDENLKIEIRRFFRAPRQRVYEAWIRPEELRKWLGPGMISVAEVGTDLRINGAYKIIMQGTPEGTPELKDRRVTVEGVYKELKPGERIQFTWKPEWSPGEESLVTVHLRDSDGGTELTLTHERFASAESKAGHERGWASTMEKLERSLAA